MSVRHNTILLLQFQVAMVALMLVLSSCSSSRGLPDHGGGKRFDEEQRLISSSIQTAIDAMDFSVLKGKKVKLVIDGVESSGGGRSTWPGIRHFSPSWNIREAGPGVEFTTENYPLGYNVDASYTANNNLTSRDMKYLEFILKMRCQLEGIQLVPNNQDVNLLVAIDVMGTNRSRDDHILVVRDHLQASTEITYCCIDAKTRKVLLGKSKVGSEATYSENWVRLTNIKGKSRELKQGRPTSYQLTAPIEQVAHLEPRRSPDNFVLDEQVDHGSILKLELMKDENTDTKKPTEEKVPKFLSAEELYRQGLEATKRKDKATLQKIIDALQKDHPKSEYIQVLKTKLSGLMVDKKTSVALANVSEE